MKKISLAHQIVYFLFISVLSLFFSAKASAVAESISLTAMPVRLGDDFSISLSPGEKRQVQIKVRNGSSEPIVLESKAVDFVIGEDGSTPVILEENNQKDSRWSLASWLTLVPAENKLLSDDVAIINVLIEVPQNALPGGHYAMVYHRPVNVSKVETSGSGISQRVGTLLYVMVKGPITEDASISRFDWPKFLENGPVNFSLNINNQSDIHISTAPVLKVYNLFGRKVAEIALEAKNIFPKSERSFSGTWNRVWGLGYYKAVVEAVYGTQGAVMTTSAGLFLIPVKLILAVVISLLIIMIATLSLKKRRDAKPVVESQPIPPSSNLEANPDKNQEESDDKEKQI